METLLPWWEFAARLLLAALLGSVIGFERERKSWAAGLRTHMLVSVGAALLMIVSAFGFADVLNRPDITLDPSRIAAQVVSGIGFLGAGAILLRGEVIRGLTTAASLWTVAAIGLAVGGGLYIGAVTATVIILVILAGLKPLEDRYRAKMQSQEILLEVDKGSVSIQVLQKALGLRTEKIKQFVVQPNEDPTIDDVILTMTRVSAEQAQAILEVLIHLPGVRKGDIR